MRNRPKVLGVVLCGGRSSRFGSDKAVAQLDGRPLLELVALRAGQQVDHLILNLNQTNEISLLDGLPVVRDLDDARRGPLAGVLAAMDWASRQLPGWRWIATFPVDCPFFPDDLLHRLVDAAIPSGRPAIAASGGRSHPTFALWPVDHRTALERFLIDENKRSVTDFARFMGAHEVDYPIIPFDPFFNINRPTDIALAARLNGGKS